MNSMEEKKERRAVAKKLITPMMKEWQPISPKMPVYNKEAETETTKEMLEAYGCNTLVLTKTDQKTEDENGALLPDEERLGSFGKLLRSTGSSTGQLSSI